MKVSLLGRRAGGDYFSGRQNGLCGPSARGSPGVGGGPSSRLLKYYASKLALTPAQE